MIIKFAYVVFFLFFLFNNAYGDKFHNILDKNYKKITGDNKSSRRAFNEIKMLYIDSILSNNPSHQKDAIKKLINGSKTINIKIPQEYYQELKALNNQDYSMSSSKVSVQKKISKKLIVEDMRLINNEITVTTTQKISKKNIKKSTWNTNGRYRHIYDISGKWKKKVVKQLNISRTKRVKIAQYKANIARIVISDTKKFPSSFKINSNKLYISYENKHITSRLKKEKVFKQNTTNKTRTVVNLGDHILSSIIVIDPGHGGKDGGAVGHRKAREKDIVLSISRLLYTKLKNQGYRNVHLTRTKDKFIQLKDRTKFANRKKADIFISIHANAVKSPNAQGIETYFLSPARSKRAKKAAAKENKKAIKSLNFSSKNIFLDVINKSKLLASNKLAIDIHKNMKYRIKQKIPSVKDHGIRSGPFWVLVGAQMPSVLVETGYVTNKKEAKRLLSKSYQRLIANGIADGISNYLSKNK